jgi:hypothetical protein
VSGLSRNDFFRMLLPGAAVVFLLDLAARIVALHPAAPFNVAQALPKFLEGPLRGLAAAFGIGFVLYFLDPGYGAPQFYQGIPSTHLKGLLERRGIKADAVSLYFRAMDELLPETLRERALLYGALYRIGFQLVLYTILVAGLLPTTILLLFRRLPPLTYGRPTPVLWVSWAAVTVAIMIPFCKRAISGKSISPGPGILAAAAINVSASILAWVNLPFSFIPRVPPVALVTTVTLAVFGAWMVVRLVGPLNIWLRHLEGRLDAKPDRPHSPIQIAALDGSIAATSLTGLVVLWPILAPAQVAATSALLCTGLTLSYLRKHERQLSGIYRNQRQWLDARLESVLDLLPTEAKLPDNESREPTLLGSFLLRLKRNLNRQ